VFTEGTSGDVKVEQVVSIPEICPVKKLIAENQIGFVLLSTDMNVTDYYHYCYDWYYYYYCC
jgi:hypothetical protein